MIIFYDRTGKVVGSVLSYTKNIESKFSIPDTNSIEVPTEIIRRLRDPEDPLSFENIAVDKNGIREFTQEEKQVIIEDRKKKRQEYLKEQEKLKNNPPKDPLAKLTERIESLERLIENRQ